MFAVEAADAVDTVFAAFGVPAQYTPTPSEPSVTCLVIAKSGDRQISFGESRPFAEGVTVEVRASDVALPVNGGVFVPGAVCDGAFVPGAVSLIVIGDPEARDALRLVWSCRVAQ